MPSTQNNTLNDWDGLLRAVRENEAEFACVAPFRDALAKAHAEALASRGARDSLVAAAQEATQQLKRALATGNDAAHCLRAYIRSVLGPRAEKLHLYGIRPYRRRR